jgi:hypothetical protein
MPRMYEQFPPREGSKVAICGFAESYKQAPFDDPTVHIWGLNELHKYLPRWDRWWEVHDSETLGVTKRDLSDGEIKRHLEWLSRNHGPNRPIYMLPEHCDGRFPNAVPHPIDELCAVFGEYFTSTIGYMVGRAILDGYEWIGLFGVDLASDIEYPRQRPNTEHLIGIAKGMGRTVELAPASAICKAAHLYGHQKPVADDRLFTAVKGHHAKLKQQHEQTLAQLHTLDGAIQECENFMRLPEFLERGVSMNAY